MQFVSLGLGTTQLSRIFLGTSFWGAATGEAEARHLLEIGEAAGVNVLDTGNNYVDGEAERMIGNLLGSARERWIVATKAGQRVDASGRSEGTSERVLREALEESLRRLRSDYVDILYLHIDDPDTPLEDTVTGLGRLLEAGKIRGYGLSNFRGWRIAELIREADRLGVARPVIAQPYYNALNRMPEIEVLPACQFYGVGVAAYSTLARGVLTGKYVKGAAPDPDSRAARHAAAGKAMRLYQTEWRDESLEIAQKVKEHAAARGMTASQYAYLWVLANKAVSAVVSGPRNAEQWIDCLDSLKHQWTEQDEALIDGLVAAGHPSTPGYTDPLYPVMGRQPQF
ncbi:MAG: aldo/keto reductase [Parvibaculum sp.]|uniref:aldo/keto reductase n=1 Tax=Parvibaculum sp. TaxID=2024848 RepID=UPI003C77D878